tara:strand:- start:164 stop:559 length:396 start_codon:yes stop_codon:yes gene_type:complete
MSSSKELRLELNYKMSNDSFMRKQNIILYLVLSLFLTGCLQTTAMMGPAITLVSTGNISQAGMTFFANKTIKDETGMNTLEFVSNKIDEGKDKKEVDDNFNINDNFIILVKNNFDKTRKIILIQNQSKTFN